jgi:hypothetical protein
MKKAAKRTLPAMKGTVKAKTMMKNQYGKPVSSVTFK